MHKPHLKSAMIMMKEVQKELLRHAETSKGPRLRPTLDVPEECNSTNDPIVDRTSKPT